MTKYYAIILWILIAVYYAGSHFIGGTEMDIWVIVPACLTIVCALIVDIIKTTKSNNALTAKIDNLQSNVINKDHSGLNKEHDRLNKEHDRLNREHEHLSADHKDLERRSESLKELLIILTTKFETKTFDASAGQALISALTSFVKTIDERVLELEKENHILKEQNRQLREVKEKDRQQENTIQHKDDWQREARQEFEPEL